MSDFYLIPGVEMDWPSDSEAGWVDSGTTDTWEDTSGGDSWEYDSWQESKDAWTVEDEQGWIENWNGDDWQEYGETWIDEGSQEYRETWIDEGSQDYGETWISEGNQEWEDSWNGQEQIVVPMNEEQRSSGQESGTVSEKKAEISQRSQNKTEKETESETETGRETETESESESEPESDTWGISPVNLFGSTFYIEESLQQQLDSFYIKEPVDILICEKSMESWSNTDIILGYEGNLRILKSGEDYEMIRMEGLKGHWNYFYQIPKETFGRDGHYQISITGKDKGIPLSDRQREEAEITFAVDRHKPLLVTAGVEEGEVYYQEQTLHVEVLDNLKPDRLEIRLNGEKVGKPELTSQDIQIKQRPGWQTIEAFAVDRAGNQSETVMLKVCVRELPDVKTGPPIILIIPLFFTFLKGFLCFFKRVKQ